MVSEFLEICLPLEILTLSRHLIFRSPRGIRCYNLLIRTLGKLLGQLISKQTLLKLNLSFRSRPKGITVTLKT